MSRICVATSSSTAYYTVVSRLRKAKLEFRSVVPSEGMDDCDIVLTTARESPEFGDRALDFERLSDDPGVFKGQVVSRLVRGTGSIMVGVDPGARIGMAAFYGEVNLAFDTFDSIPGLCRRVGEFVRSVPSRKAVIRVGSGNMALAVKIVRAMEGEVPGTPIELVDEAGTSDRSGRMKGVQGDQSAAAKIAFRKGSSVQL